MPSRSALTVKVISWLEASESRSIETPGITSSKALSARVTVSPSMIASAFVPTVMLFALCACPWASGGVPSIVRPAIELEMFVMRASSPVLSDARTSW